MSRYSVSLENGRKFEFDAQAGLSQYEATALLQRHLQYTAGAGEAAPDEAVTGEVVTDEVVTDEEAREANTGFFNNLGSTYVKLANALREVLVP